MKFEKSVMKKTRRWESVKKIEKKMKRLFDCFLTELEKTIWKNICTIA